jgi:uncharacterized protein CbrC (UPF0167 family)
MRPFDLFAAPAAYSTWSDDAECHFCGAEGAFESPFLGEEEIDAVCDECLAEGKLAEIGLSTNQGDSVALRTQLASKRLPMHEAEALLDEQLRQVEQLTPAWVSWQDQLWPAHCGQFARYVKVMGRDDVLERCADKPPADWLAEALHDPEDADMEALWGEMRPGSPTDQSEAYSTEFYLFECRVCGHEMVMWDCE